LLELLNAHLRLQAYFAQKREDKVGKTSESQAFEEDIKPKKEKKDKKKRKAEEDAS
jgi:hypothetical protein